MNFRKRKNRIIEFIRITFNFNFKRKKIRNAKMKKQIQ